MPRSLREADYDLPVQLIRVTMHTMGHVFEGDERSGNHSSIFLITGRDSVRLNMIKAGATATMGTFEATRVSYQQSNSSVHNIDLVTKKGVTVGHVMDLISSKGRDNYELHRSGVGCRFWTGTIVEDLDHKGWIVTPRDATNVTWSGLSYNYSRGLSPVPEEIKAGKFKKKSSKSASSSSSRHGH